MIRTLDFNAFAAGTVIDDEYATTEGVTVSATGGSGQAMLFDTNNPTGGDTDLASDTLDGVLIISEDGDSSDPDDNDAGGSLFFDFNEPSFIKSLTFKDIEETSGDGTLMIFYDADGGVIDEHFVQPTDDGGERTVGLGVDGVSRLEVRFEGSGAVDNLVFDDKLPVDEGPTAVDDSGETDEDTAVIIDLRGNDTDPNDLRDDLVIGDFVSADGTVTDLGDGTVSFLPNPDFSGETTFTYSVTDPAGNSDTGEVTVLVNPVNDAPAAVNDADTTDFNTPITVDLLANDTDVDLPEGDMLTVTSVSVPVEQGTVLNNNDGTALFTPADGFTGDATISYTIEDAAGLSDSAEHVVTVADGAGNSAPVTAPDTAETDEDTASDPIDVLDNDSDPDGDTLQVTEATSPDGTVEITADNELIFTPNPDFNGETTITYTAADPSGAETPGTVTVTVNPVNDAPVAVDDSDETDLNTAIELDLLANDSDVDGDALTVVSATVPVDQGTVSAPVDGVVTFTPADGFAGVATVSYTIEDEEGLQDSAEHTVTVSGTPANNAPIAVDDVATTDEDTAVVLDLVDNDSDPDGDLLTVTAVSVPADQGTVVNNDDGTATFTPALDFNGEATVTYTIADPDGAEATAVHVVDVTPVNDAPVANDDTDTTAEETPITVDLLDNDSDVDGDTLTVVGATVPADQGTLLDNGDGTVTFTPATDFTGPATISYSISDGNGGADSAEHVIDVTPVNDAPVAGDDMMGTPYNTPITDIPVLANDTDVDEDPLRVVTATTPDGDVIINDDGTLTFTPTDGFTGPAEITYTISDRPAGDPEALTDEGTLIVNVAAPGGRDGIVDGTIGDDLIDPDYLGDPDGDLVDNEDAIIPGQEPNDDIIRAGDGSDTVEAGLGDDYIDGGTGDDSILGEDGNDTVVGGEGDDVINTSGPDLAPDRGYPDAPTDALGFDGDDDPENDRDSVIGGAGNDTITTGDDRDTIIGGTGEDVIDAGIDDDFVDSGLDDDRIVGGEGNDTIFGGGGDDTIYAGNDPDGVGDLLDITDEDTGGFSPDRNPDNGRDVVDGGAGDDVIFGADDGDSLSGGSGNDTIDGQIDDDTIRGESGDDSLLGGQGNDTIDGGTGEDTLEGGIGDDTLRGNRNDDVLIGGTGDDVLDGGGENDVLDGGDGDDNLQGGQGDDTLRGGTGDDILDGGAGQDVFEDLSAGDNVDGGSGPIDNDTLDLRGSAPDGGRLEVTYTSDDREDGVVNFFDVDGADAGRLVFEEIENVIPCFTPGTKIATPKGERLVEELEVGDRVITRDNGIQDIRWVGARDMSGAELEKSAHLKPVLIRQGALGNDLPERDMIVSPNHRVLVANDKTALYFEEREVLVAAKHLTGLEGVDIVDVSHTTYIHVMFDQHEVILSDGAWTESFQPGDMSLAGIGNAQRQEILELFPELATKAGVEGYASARRALKKHEAKLITD